MSQRSLADHVAASPPEMQRAISSIWIGEAAGRWIARASISTFLSDPGLDPVLPDGVSRAAIHRHPDVEWDLDPTMSVEIQIRTLHATGMLGSLDAARYNGSDCAPSWVVKTHAGTQAERTAWMLRDT